MKQETLTVGQIRARQAKAAGERNSRQLVDLLVENGLPRPDTEVEFHPRRKWRFDLAYKLLKIGIEIEGGAFAKRESRHTEGVGYRNDCEKYNQAQLCGWIVMRFTSDQLSGRQREIVVATIRRAIEYRRRGVS